LAGNQTTPSAIPAVTINGALALLPQQLTVAVAPSIKFSFCAVAGTNSNYSNSEQLLLGTVHRFAVNPYRVSDAK
jgi:hypothetical protein